MTNAQPPRLAIHALIGLAMWFGLWMILPFGPERTLPSFDHVLFAGLQQWKNGQLASDVLASLVRITIGVTIGAALASVSGMLLLWKPIIAGIVLSPLDLLRSVPPIAIGPIAIALFGIGDLPATLIVAFGSFFPIYQSIRFGLTQIKTDHMEVAHCFGGDRWIKLGHVIIPTLSGHAMNGLTIGLGIGWFCVVAAEMLGANSGLGFRLQNMSLNLNSAGMWFYILIIGLIGFAMAGLARLATSLLCPWQKQHAVQL